MIDVAGFKGVEMLGDNYEITVEDIESAMKKQNITLRRAHAVLIHAGWGKLYGKDNPRYVKHSPRPRRQGGSRSRPGLDLAVARLYLPSIIK